MKPLVSVIIPNYNYSRYIAEAIDSVLNQTYSNIEVIVVDDGSKDNSEEVIRGYGSEIVSIFQQNRGVSAARNAGVEKSRGIFICFLDADDSWFRTKVESQLARFEDEQIGLAHVGVEEIDANGNPLGQNLDGMEGLVSKELLLFERPVILGGGSGVMIRRSVFDEVGGFDTRLSTSADWDFSYQVSSRYQVGFVNEVLLRYRIHGSNMHSNIRVMERDMLIGYRKAFAGRSEVDRSLRRKSYGNLHRVLAGSHFRSGNYPEFAKNAVKCLGLTPGNLPYFLQFPFRRLKSK